MEERWKNGGIKNWANTQLLILGGVHGHKDGKVGDTDKRFVTQNVKMIGILKRKFGKEMEENNIQVEQVDVGQHKNRSEVDKEKLS